MQVQEIVTERLILRRYCEDDLEGLLATFGRDDMARYLYTEPWTEDVTRGRLGDRLTRNVVERPGDPLQLAVIRREDGRYLGEMSLHWHESEHREGEIGFVLHPDYHGRGYAREAAREMLRIAFEELGLHRVIGRCDARNDASARLMERLGMRREAHFRSNEFVKGEWTDELLYAMLEDEWRATREG